MLACRDQIAGGRAVALPRCVEWCARHRRGPQVGAAPRRCCCVAVAALEEGEMARRKRGEREVRAAGGRPTCGRSRACAGPLRPPWGMVKTQWTLGEACSRALEGCFVGRHLF
ncbi:hypothetical protein NDU88_001268 [Pleurodeles waltl]|uniref:Uncharacterized protein n=1 Tax=Pleurodeles waltl TaxID=8319 RepID=A0AAV7M0M5_PLEWA|nr:hypothetical protein NDU88_001268 [Pleurodeles waltl]